MFFYEVALSGLKLRPLTYCADILINNFQKVLVSVRKKPKVGFILRQVEKPNFICESILKISDERLSKYQISLCEFIAKYYTCELGSALDLFTPLVNSQSEFTPKIWKKAPNLSDMQNKALEFCENNKIALIFGDTGSGKSEIYIEKIRRTLNSNKQALLLMPEISLTPQMRKRLENYFGDSVGIWHSKISPKNKRELLNGFFSGRIRLIAGARSALFLPFTKLGLIVIDEEHDDSYKNQSLPCYNARDLAIFIGHKLGIPVILGSATPSVSSYAKFPYFRLKGTFFKSQKQVIIDNNEVSLSPTIKNELRSTLKRGKQAVIFLPTRANFKFLLCGECGEIIKCPFCSVSMSLHKNHNALKCHYCGFATSIPNSCPVCGSEILEARKIGTSELKNMLESEFTEAKIAKFDKDEITTTAKLERLLKDFNDKKIDILVGTQMLSKGHDYHDVELAVIMGLDEHLAYCDFRAREKTLALAIQTAGRAGRAGLGKVLIQTSQGDFFESYLQDYDAFLENELELRKPLYPPFTRLLRILIQDKSDEKATQIEEEILARLQNVKNIEIIGHGKALIEFIASKFRRQILLRANSHVPLLKAAMIARNLGATADIDPINFS